MKTTRTLLAILALASFALAFAEETKAPAKKDAKPACCAAESKDKKDCKADCKKDCKAACPKKADAKKEADKAKADKK